VIQIYSTPVLGASGAIFGILVAFGMLFPNSEIMLLLFPVPIKAKYFVGFYFLYELYEGIANNPGDEVAHFAHVGGAVFGFILVKIWNRNRDYLY
jgi:membrane associated rhomboid family serine protease